MSNIADMSFNQVVDKVKEKASDVQNKTKEKFNEASEKTEEGLDKAAQKIQEEVTDLNQMLHTYIQEKPLTTLAVAIGIGAVLGALISK